MGIINYPKINPFNRLIFHHIGINQHNSDSDQ